MRIAEHEPISGAEDRFREAGQSVFRAANQAAAPPVEVLRRRHRRHRATSVILALVALTTMTTGTLILRQDQHVTVEMAGGPGPLIAPAVPQDAISWRSKTVALEARDMHIRGNGLDFSGRVEGVRVSGDRGNSEYQTLEVAWREHGVNMRLNFYFGSDGREWWVDEIRVYDGRPKGDWVFFEGRRGQTPIGQAFTGDLRLDGGGLALNLRGLRLQAFTPPMECAPSGHSYVAYVPWDLNGDAIDMEIGNTYAVGVQLYDSVCGQVEDLTPFSFTWTLGNSSLAEMVTNGQCRPGDDSPGCTPYLVNVVPSSAGNTDLRIDIRRKAEGLVVANTTVQLRVDD
jgi:hypothetical protein